MGGLKKPKKKYLAGKPKKIWNKQLLLEELQLVGEYGLRNKKELWLARAHLKRITRRARSLLSMTAEERVPLEMPFKERLYKMGFIEDPNVPLDRILSLDVRSVLERRLQTMVYRLGLAKSIHHARQLIVHGRVLVAGRRMTSPGFLVPRELEDKISLAQ
ncbi:MAG: 30S ribosomal protein S4 [Pyrobaculum sp.]|jgi:small subunit ribosomal protein S4